MLLRKGFSHPEKFSFRYDKRLRGWLVKYENSSEQLCANNVMELSFQIGNGWFCRVYDGVKNK